MVRMEINGDIDRGDGCFLSLSERAVRQVVRNVRWSNNGVWKSPMILRYRNDGRCN